MMIKRFVLQSAEIMREEGSVLARNNAAGYLRQSNVLALLGYMSSLLLEVQNHRGASMAVLAGSEEFVPSLELAKRRVTAYVCLIEQYDSQFGGLLSSSDWHGIQTEWQVLNHGWQSDEVLTNFEFHSHLIDCLIKMITKLSAILQQTGEEPSARSVLDKHSNQLVLHVCLKLMPELMENIAKLRGLSTHVCVMGECNDRIRLRLGSLQQELNFNKEGLREACKALPHASLTELPAMAKLLLNEHKLGQLQQLIQNQVMDPTRVKLDGEKLFTMASDIIEAYYQVVVDSLFYFQQDLRRHWLG